MSARRAPAVLVTAVVAVILLAGCGDEGTADATGGGGGGGGGPVACTEIGCASGLYMDLRPIDRGLPAAERVRICVGDQCRTFALGGANIADMRVAGLKERDRVRVRMTILGENGRVLRSSAVAAPVRRSKPNGPHCPPTCFQVAVRIDRDSLRLQASA